MSLPHACKRDWTGCARPLGHDRRARLSTQRCWSEQAGPQAAPRSVTIRRPLGREEVDCRRIPGILKRETGVLGMRLTWGWAQ